MSLQQVVPYASVILTWILPHDNEPHSNQARALRGVFIRSDCDLCVQTLWVFEVGNILALNYPDDAGAMLESVSAMASPVHRSGERFRALAMELAVAPCAIFYDASHHVTAIVTDSVLVTADERYLHKAESAGAICPLADRVAL